MLKAWVIAIALVLFIGVTGYAQANDQTKKFDEIAELVKNSDKLDNTTKAFVLNKLLPLSIHKTLVEETTKQNDQKVTLDKIKEIDKQWREAEEELDIMVEKLSNTTAKKLLRHTEANPTIAEAFAMDNQGAVVGESHLTSDYWQGDEAKWQNSYKEAQGGIDVGDPELDESTNMTLQQVSLPIINEKGEVIGAITWGIQVN